MSLERAKELYSDYMSAVQRLKEAIDVGGEMGDVSIDGTIQRFEFSFELGWKLAKAILKYQGVDVQTPRQVIKEAYVSKMISAGEDWIDMLEDRNKTSHIYDAKQAWDIYLKIKEKHCSQLEKFVTESTSFIA